MIRANNRKISSFVATETIEDDAYLDYVHEGTNYRISFSDLQDALGVNGSSPYAQITLQNNATATDIVTQSVPVKVAGTWVADGASGFTAATNGRLTYTGSASKRLTVHLNTSVATSSGSNKKSAIYVAKNGTVISGSRITDIVEHAHHATCTVYQVTLATNDYIEAFIANETDTVDLVVTEAILQVS